MLRISQTSGAQIVNLLSKATTEPPESNTAENGTTKGKLRGNGGKETGSRVHLGNQAHLGTLRVRRVDMCVCWGVWSKWSYITSSCFSIHPSSLMALTTWRWPGEVSAAVLVQ